MKAGEYVLIAGAVPLELAGIETCLTGATGRRVGPRRAVDGRLGSLPVRLLETGPGSLNAAMAITAAIQSARPGLILMTGCAGAYAGAGLTVGDVAVATAEIDAHLGVESPRRPGGLPAPLPFPVMETSGSSIRYRYPLSAPWVDTAWRALRGAFDGADFRLGRGPFVTVSTVTASWRRARALAGAYGGVMETMEGAGAAHVALTHEIPLIHIRCASNRTGVRDPRRWRLDLACRRAARAAAALLTDTAVTERITR